VPAEPKKDYSFELKEVTTIAAALCHKVNSALSVIILKTSKGDINKLNEYSDTLNDIYSYLLLRLPLNTEFDRYVEIATVKSHIKTIKAIRTELKKIIGD